ncbi:MAG: hypothetical protein ACQEP7_00475 [bacterium]
MATFQSRAEVKEACRKLLELERKNKKLIQHSEELPLDQIEKIVKKQSRLIEEIDFNSSADELPDEIAQLARDFMELRDKNSRVIKESMEQVESRLDSLEQSSKLMRHYMQGGMRDEESASARIDHNA